MPTQYAKPYSRAIGRGFTILELSVVVAVIGVLIAITLPAVMSAREAARSTACQSNLRQLVLGMQNRASQKGVYCSGAFNWQYDGSVTDIGWVTDLVNQGIFPANLLCGSNPLKMAETYQDLLGTPIDQLTICNVNYAGNPPQILPDGTTAPQGGPCWQIWNHSSTLQPNSTARQNLVYNGVYVFGANTNYTASWILVRGAVNLDANGNLLKSTSCSNGSTATYAPLLDRVGTVGPLTTGGVDSSIFPSSAIPFLGCGAPATGKTLPMNIGPFESGMGLTVSFTDGPVQTSNMQPLPAFPAGTPYAGPNGWSAAWKQTLQDYRNFAPVHRGACNIGFADGSVKTVIDFNIDGQLNNGFPPTSDNGFIDGNVEILPSDFFSAWSLRGT
jgi:prepilin-type N-terminal cleavage/methylation domain-containing protein/prepilin-type processing-associated H-X9-DG protein